MVVYFLGYDGVFLHAFVEGGTHEGSVLNIHMDDIPHMCWYLQNRLLYCSPVIPQLQENKILARSYLGSVGTFIFPSSPAVIILWPSK